MTTTTTPTSGAADLPEALINIAREIEALKRDCGMDPESAIAIQNGRYMAISYKVRALAAGQATAAQAGEYPALVCDYCGALTPDPWHSSGMLHGKMSKHIHSCDACAPHGQAPAQPDQPIACSYGDNGYACCEGGPCQADVHNDKLAEQQAPQPVAREPLTPERVKEIVRGAGYDQCGIPDTERAAFINGLRHGEQAHGIKVGQHGDDKQ